ncbi:MAG: type II secretion system F family protein [Coriobacteriales bacterium]|jgi:tight adherence protein B|nr:type II secretion system F family protein [Coriobacteriales bacterium]
MALVSAGILIVAVAAAALGGALALPVLLGQGIQALHRLRLRERLTYAGEGKATLLAGLCQRGVMILRPFSRLLLHIRWLRVGCERCARALTISGYGVAEASRVCELLLAGCGLLGLLVLIITGMPVTAFCSVALALVLAFGKAQKLLGNWEGRLVEQIPDALRSLGICFNAGYSLQQAFDQVANDTPDPLGAELKQASFDIRAGRSIEEALAALERRTRASDFRFAIVALEIQHRTGGSLQDLLENAADAVLASADLYRQLAVQTAQARLSAKVVTVLPLALVAVLSLAMEGYLQSFFSSSEGLAILFVALGMEALGIVVIRRILGVDLG